MNARAPAFLLIATLFTAACGEIVQIGAQDDEPLPPTPLPGDPCLDLPCGASCPLTTCTDNECPPSVGGACNFDGVCTLSVPVCVGTGVDPDPRCAELPCGTPCAPCDPADPTCTPEMDGGSGSPPLVCDALQQCNAEPISCL